MRSAAILLGMAVFVGITGQWACGEDAGGPVNASVSALPGIGSTRAANENAGSPASVRVDIQMVSVSVAEARHLVPALQDRKTAQTAWARVQAMIARDEAKLLAWPVLWLQSGRWPAGPANAFPVNFPFTAQHGTTESMEELRYPTEFTPPQVPTVFGPVPLISPTWGVDSHIPTAFEARNVGDSFEAEVMAEHDGQVVTLNLVARFDRLVGFRRWRTQRSPLGIVGLFQQPDFQNAKVTVQLSVQRDQPVLIGSFVLSEPEPHVELFILHARAKLLPPNAVFPPSK